MLPSLCKNMTCHNLTSLMFSEDSRLPLPLHLYYTILAFISCWEKEIINLQQVLSILLAKLSRLPTNALLFWAMRGLMIQLRNTRTKTAYSQTCIFVTCKNIHTTMIRLITALSGDFQWFRSGRVHVLTHFRYFQVEMPWYLDLSIFNTKKINSRLCENHNVLSTTYLTYPYI